MTKPGVFFLIKRVCRRFAGKFFKIYCIFTESMIQYIWIVNPKNLFSIFPHASYLQILRLSLLIFLEMH